MNQLKLAGVPEHFNLPIHLGIEENTFQKVGIDISWKDVSEGTGAMIEQLRNGKIDGAFVLTEGAIKAIHNGLDASIVKIYVNSPLRWGIHVAANSSYQKLSDLKNTSAAISRFGSGSNLMAYVNAENLGWSIDDLKFEVIQNLTGARENLPKGIGDYFLWEKFTTKPYVDNGEFRIIGECPTPWPCFVLVIRNDYLNNHNKTVSVFLNSLNALLENFRNRIGLIDLFVDRYQQKQEDIETWFNETQWSSTNQISKEMIQKSCEVLKRLNIIDQIPEFKNLVTQIDQE